MDLETDASQIAWPYDAGIGPRVTDLHRSPPTQARGAGSVIKYARKDVRWRTKKSFKTTHEAQRGAFFGNHDMLWK